MFVFCFILFNVIFQCLANTKSSNTIECGLNEYPVKCKTTCPPQSCDLAYTEYLCDPNPNPKCVPGCDCIENYLRDDTGMCIFNEDCPYPIPPPLCGEFEEPIICDDSDIQCNSDDNCKCIDQYVRNSSGNCVPVAQNNTIQCGYNEVPSDCKQTCPPQDCDFSYDKYACKAGPCSPGCDCIGDYLRNSTGDCVPGDQCDTAIQCGYNEVPSDCKQTCPPQDCDFSYDKYACKAGPCSPGCNCIGDYLRNSTGHCVPGDQCDTAIQCGYNEVPSNCKQTCPPQDCDFSYDKYACKAGPCSPGCDCIGDYLRNSTGDCVPGDQCDTDEYDEPEDDYGSEASSSASSSASAYASSSAYSFASSSSSDDMNTNTGGAPCIYDRCTPTCSVPTPSDCPQTSNPCNCATGYILSEKGGQYVKIEECQKYLNCNGDRNATQRECANSCKSTCKKPNAVCSRECEGVGCQCDPLYLLSDEGKCILPDDCPGGNPCRQNETFVFCNVGCPTNYCPTSDSRAMVACDPPYPCPSGCSCKANHKRLSYDDDRCILASDCPPVNCTRQNEEWNPCPPPCFTETCRDLNRPPLECYRYGLNCQPQCVCKDGYRRNDRDVCIPITEC